MAVLGAIAVPHPPLIMPEVGNGREKIIEKTIESYRKAMAFVSSLKPDTVIITSPHAKGWRDCFSISSGSHAYGDFSDFRAPQLEIGCDYDEELAQSIADELKKDEIRAILYPYGEEALDHATMIPLRFLSEFITDVKVVRISLSGFSPLAHYKLGEAVAKCAEKLGRRIVMIASGDLSHKLKEDGPYGYSADGPVFDRDICEIFKSGDFLKLLNLNQAVCESAAECGYRSFLIMAGALDSLAVKPELLSYEGPFGVGYAVATFRVEGSDPKRNFAAQYEKIQQDLADKRHESEDIVVSLARRTIESVVKSGILTRAATTDDLRAYLPQIPQELTKKKASCFVTIHKYGNLRGCIGTLMPVCSSLGEEIERNAISACSSDPRFDPVTESELPYLEYSVDVLDEPESIKSPEELNPRVYGVIVRKGARRGVLLPDLDGVDTVEQQLSIAKRKAGLDPYEEGCSLKRFTVKRHF